MPLRLRRTARAAWRDTIVLLRQFRPKLTAFVAAPLLCAALYDALATYAGLAPGFAKSLYIVLALTVFQPMTGWPDQWYLQAFFFAMPAVGLALITLGLPDFLSTVLDRRRRGQEWTMAVASTYQRHVVVVGLGHLGLRVVRRLVDLGRDVVAIDRDADAGLIEEARALDVPVLVGDARGERLLAGAGAASARTVVLCTQDDAVNLQIALKARALNPAIAVVIRIFDDDFAQQLARQFGFRALSATSMAAPVFAAAAADLDVTPPVVVEGHHFSLARFVVEAGSTLCGRRIGDVEQESDVSIVFLSRGAERDAHPAGDRALLAGDQLAVLGDPARLERFASRRQPDPDGAKRATPV